jgi:hypothetical protein
MYCLYIIYLYFLELIISLELIVSLKLIISLELIISLDSVKSDNVRISSSSFKDSSSNAFMDKNIHVESTQIIDEDSQKRNDDNNNRNSHVIKADNQNHIVIDDDDILLRQQKYVTEEEHLSFTNMQHPFNHPEYIKLLQIREKEYFDHYWPSIMNLPMHGVVAHMKSQFRFKVTIHASP